MKMTYSDEFLVLGVVAVFSEDRNVSFLAIDSLADFIKAVDKSYYSNDSLDSNINSLAML